KDLNLTNVSLSSEERALTLNQVYEARLENITLKDKADGKNLLITGADSGAIFVENTDELELGHGLEEKILNPEDKQAW
ncbi:MAG TPA: hypothetical protein VIC08_08605, partial [Cellvibrionaceae bacterium]